MAAVLLLDGATGNGAGDGAAAYMGIDDRTVNWRKAIIDPNSVMDGATVTLQTVARVGSTTVTKPVGVAFTTKDDEPQLVWVSENEVLQAVISGAGASTDITVVAT